MGSVLVQCPLLALPMHSAIAAPPSSSPHRRGRAACVVLWSVAVRAAPEHRAPAIVTDADLGRIDGAGTRWSCSRTGAGPGPGTRTPSRPSPPSLRSGADGVELDVRRSADGELVVHHDAEVPGCGPHPRAPRRRAPGVGPDLGAGPGVVRRGHRQRRDQERPDRPRLRPRPTGWPLDVAAAPRPRTAGPGEPWPAHVVVSSFWPDTLAARGRVGDVAGAVPLGAPRPPRARRVVGARDGRCARVRGAQPSSLPGQRGARRAGPTTRAGRRHVDGEQPRATSTPWSRPASTCVITDDVADTLAHLGRR